MARIAYTLMALIFRRSSLVRYQSDEDVLERALRRLKILEANSAPGQVPEERGDGAAVALFVVGIDQIGAFELEPVGGERRRKDRQRLLQVQRQLLLPELAHQLGLLLDKDDLA